MAPREMSDFSIWVKHTPVWVYKESFNPFKNRVVDIPFVSLGESRLGESHSHHVSFVQTIFRQ